MAAAKTSTTQSNREIAQRLLLARTVFRLASGEFAKGAGIAQTTYSNFERGSRPGLTEALKLKAKYNLSLDWLYTGDMAGLPFALAELIRNTPQPQAAPDGRRKERPALPPRARPFRAVG